MANERPKRLNREGRPEDPNFQPVEKLFRRFQRRHLAGGEFSGVGLSFKKGDAPDAPSVNREKYSEARDVLLPEGEKTFVGWGVISWQVQQIPTSLPLNRPEFTIRPVGSVNSGPVHSGNSGTPKDPQKD